MSPRLWVCETCGSTWTADETDAPFRDDHGRVICADCLADLEELSR